MLPNTSQPSKSSEFSHIHLLIIEDLPDNMELLKLDLQDQLPGVKITEASDGVEALEKLRAQDFSVVICDVLLPRMDGFEVLRQTRQIPHRDTLPFLFLSALNQEEAIKKGLALGAVDYVTKPYDEEILAYKVRNLAQLKFLQDELRRTQEELERANRFLAELNDEKNQMLRLLSHDLRSPLSGIRGLARILQTDESGNPETVREFAQLIENSITNILPIVDELTFMSHFSAGQLMKKQCDLEQLLQNVLNLLDPLISKKNIQLSTKFDSLSLYADCAKLLQMLHSLILPIVENAHPQSTLRITTRASSFSTVLLHIENDNTAISDATITKLQGGKENNARSLSPLEMSFRLARLITQLHQGSLEIEKSGKNVIIQLSLPANVTNES